MISLWVSLLMISIIWIFGSLISSSFVIKCSCSIGFFLMSCLVAFHYRSYGTFFLHKNRLHNIYRGFTHYKYYRAYFLTFDGRSLSYHHFLTLIAFKTSLYQKISSRHTSRFEVRNLRMFLKVIFLHLTSAIRVRWDVVVQFSDDFLMCTPIDDIHNLEIRVCKVQ